MRNYLLLFGCFFIAFCSCEKEDKGAKGKEVVVKKTIENFKGFVSEEESTDPHGEVKGYHKFSFKEAGEVAQDATNWDIAFNRTTIIVNGGESSDGEPERTGKGACYIAEGILDEVTVDTEKFQSQAVPKKWYTYNTKGNHIIRPIPGKVIVIRTHDGKFAKMVIKSYYKDGKEETSEFARYYTFDYIYEIN